MTTPSPPAYPAGPFPAPLPPTVTPAELAPVFDALAAAPSEVRAAVEGLDRTRLGTLYLNWTLRQIAHHLADSHMNAYTRCMLAMTEDTPTVRPYDEGAWSALAASKTADVETGLGLLEAVHAKWDALLRTMTQSDLGRSFLHPEHGASFRLADMAPLYLWHARHHTAQIRWRREVEGWA